MRDRKDQREQQSERKKRKERRQHDSGCRRWARLDQVAQFDAKHSDADQISREEALNYGRAMLGSDIGRAIDLCSARICNPHLLETPGLITAPQHNSSDPYPGRPWTTREDGPFPCTHSPALDPFYICLRLLCSWIQNCRLQPAEGFSACRGAHAHPARPWSCHSEHAAAPEASRHTAHTGHTRCRPHANCCIDRSILPIVPY